MYSTYLRLKACPKCGGDILVDRVDEGDAVCIQCGFRGFARVADDEGPEDQLRKAAPRARRQTGSRSTSKV